MAIYDLERDNGLRLEFSVAFFWKTSGNEIAGILNEQSNRQSWYINYSIVCAYLDLEFHIHYKNKFGPSPHTSGKFIFKNYFKPNSFKFVAFSFNFTHLTLHDGKTMFIKQNSDQIFIEPINERIVVGSAVRDGKIVTMNKNVAISCLSVFPKSLTEQEIYNLICSCETVEIWQNSNSDFRNVNLEDVSQLLKRF